MVIFLGAQKLLLLGLTEPFFYKVFFRKMENRIKKKKPHEKLMISPKCSLIVTVNRIKMENKGFSYRDSADTYEQQFSKWLGQCYGECLITIKNNIVSKNCLP